ncbi:MAG TPA: ABC transporter permease [Anaerolineaceae bacterium]
MLQYILKRVLLMIPTIFVISFVAFIIIDLPPSDYAETYVATLAANGNVTSQETLDQLRNLYGLGEPAPERYVKWMWGIVTRGDFGIAFQYNQPVSSMIWDRIWLTMAITLGGLLISWLIAFPVGIYSAVRQYSMGDYLATFLAFVAISVPSFLLALVIMYIRFKYFDITMSGLFSSEMEKAPWSLSKVADFFEHAWLPIIVLGIGAIGGLIRTLRANLLDEMRKPYVITARAKGLPEWKVVTKYPLRLALNPFISGVGFTLPQLVNGSIIISVVMNLPLVGSMLLSALTAQDMYLAGSLILITSVLTIIGVFLSDLLLAWVDPRIRFE